jgi:hypothetical protein
VQTKRTTLVAVSFLLFASLWSLSAMAQGEKRKATIDFEDELIEGEVKKPELFYLLNKKQFNFKRLIKLRKNFIPEMERTSEELRHTGRNK